MYAVIMSGGKQYRVKKGQIVTLEKIELEPGSEIKFDNVLLVGEGEDVKVGTPYVEGCNVKASIKDHGRGNKVNIIKFKRRKHQMKRQGHRQWFTTVEITDIAGGACNGA